ncbi:hypothetical protein R3P38DRAFT_2499383 [Favolaschia claudopus]|uniref:F-box domain-containing protein n=1 Tax=Favolaschia claudopus TaxID=2862362 RepID=A0AAW0DX56_9AGAR
MTPNEPCTNCGFASAPPDACDQTELHFFPHHLSGSNEPPTDLETLHLEKALAQKRVLISDLDDKIAALQSKIAEYQRLRQSAALQIQRDTAILSAVRRIPHDVLLEIFAWTVPDDARMKHVHATHRCPWVLGHVCSRWRAISVGSPKLWTHIDRRLPLGMIKAQLDRSLPHPLTVELGFSDKGRVELLIACSSRWEAADIEMRGLMGPALAAVQGQLPLLRRLKYHDNNGFRLFGAFSSAPVLRDVSLSGRASVVLPWSQVKRLNLKLLDSTILNPLEEAQNIEELSVTGRPLGQLPSPGAMELSCLRKLLIKNGVFLDSLILPALNDLYVSMDLTSVPSLIHRSNCHLTRFTTDVQCMSADILTILELTPSLVDLRISAIQDVKVLLSRLTINNSSSELTAYTRPLVPALRALVVTNVSDPSACTQLVAMMESRRASTPVCAEVSLCVFDFIKWSALGLYATDTRDKLRGMGFNVEWLTGPQAMDRYRSWRPGYP